MLVTNMPCKSQGTLTCSWHPSWQSNGCTGTPWGCWGGRERQFRCVCLPHMVPHFPHSVPMGMLPRRRLLGVGAGCIPPSLQHTHQPLPYCLRGSSSALSHPAPQAGGDSPRGLRKWLLPVGRRSKAAVGRVEYRDIRSVPIAWELVGPQQTGRGWRCHTIPRGSAWEGGSACTPVSMCRANPRAQGPNAC